jgi:hypothetical protein
VTTDLPTPVPADLFAHTREFDLDAFGVTVRLRVAGSGLNEVADHLLHQWARCNIREVTAETAPDGPVLLVALDEDEALHERVWELQGVAGETLEIVSNLLVSAVTFRAIDHLRGQLLMVHAAGLADPTTGRTAVLVGDSGTGKSTACRVLAQHLGYVTDETVAITTSAEVLHYPKPISLFPEGRTWGKNQHSPDDLGLQPAPESLSLGPILLLQRSESASSTPEVLDLPIGEAIARLGEHASYVGELEAPLHHLARTIRAATATLHVTYRDAEDLLPVLTELLAIDESPALPEPLPQPPLSDLDLDVLPYGLKFGRLPILDVYSDDEGGAAMTLDGRVIALSAMAARTMTLVGEGFTTVAEVAAALSAEFGAPPERELADGEVWSSEEVALRHTDDIVADLIANGLVSHLDESANSTH